jgi:hypothetical protein
LEAAARIRQAIRQAGRQSMLFLGWQDEAHDQEPSARRAELVRYGARFHHFNVTPPTERLDP